MFKRNLPRLLVLGLPILVLPACGYVDPVDRSGTWKLDGANAANLAAMIADPHDLIRGRQGVGTDGLIAAAAVRRYRDGRTSPLTIESTSTTIGGGGGGGSGGTGGNASTPAGGQ